MTQWIEVVPAYGRDYTNQIGVKRDWNADKDFQEVVSGSYINKSGAKALGAKVIVRYDKHRKVINLSGV